MDTESKKLLDALKSEPDFKLSQDFADRVVDKIKASEEKQVLPSFWQYLVISSVFLVAAVLVLILFAGKQLTGILMENLLWVVVAVVLVLVFQYLDRKLLSMRGPDSTYTFSGNRQ